MFDCKQLNEVTNRAGTLSFNLNAIRMVNLISPNENGAIYYCWWLICNFSWNAEWVWELWVVLDWCMLLVGGTQDTDSHISFSCFSYDFIDDDTLSFRISLLLIIAWDLTNHLPNKQKLQPSGFGDFSCCPFLISTINWNFYSIYQIKINCKVQTETFSRIPQNDVNKYM